MLTFAHSEVCEKSFYQTHQAYSAIIDQEMGRGFSPKALWVHCLRVNLLIDPHNIRTIFKATNAYIPVDNSASLIFFKCAFVCVHVAMSSFRPECS